MEMVNIKINGSDYAVPADSLRFLKRPESPRSRSLLSATSRASTKSAHAVFALSKSRAREILSPRASIRRYRGHGDLYEHPEGPRSEKDQLWSLSSPPIRRNVSPASAAATASCKSSANDFGVTDEPTGSKAKTSNIRRMRAFRRSLCATTTSVSSAAAASPPVRTCRASASSVRSTAAFDTHIGSAFEKTLAGTCLRLLRTVYRCLSCRRALLRKTTPTRSWEALNDPTKHVAIMHGALHSGNPRRMLRL